MLLPPSSEVPSRPVIEGRESQDKGCFGLFTFVMVLFLFQGTAAIFGANYQMPHEFALCRSRLKQESVRTARDIPNSEIQQVGSVHCFTYNSRQPGISLNLP